MTASKVKAVQPNGSWQTNSGSTLYKFEYTMEDGTVLEANHQKPDGNFPVGSDVEYEVTRDNKFGKSGKVKKPQTGNYGGGNNYQNQSAGAGQRASYQGKGGSDKSKVASMALAYAKDLIVATGGEFASPDEMVDSTLHIAERFNTWIESKS